MKLFSRSLRMMRINYIFMRYNIDEIILGSHHFHPLRYFIYLNPYYYFSSQRKTARGVRLRLALEALGPIFVKAGQIFSTRRDILPDDIALELAKLQDKVPPFCGHQAKQIIEAALKCPLDHVFAEFDPQALASASIAQVHAAKLLDGTPVVIKVLRPNIYDLLTSDIDLLTSLAKIANRYMKGAKYFKPQQLVAEVAQTLYDELDLLREGANASQLKRNFKNSPILHIPKIYWNYSHTNVLVMERVFGVPIYDIERLHQAGVDMHKLAQRGLEIFFTQVFRDSFFHADWHPGNIFVSITDPKNPTYISVDFGIVGSLNQEDKRYLAENMIAFFKRDYQRVAELHIASGWIPPGTRIDQFEGAIRAVSEPIFEQPLRDISFGKLLLRLFQVARRFNINIQPQLILLQKSLVNIEGISRQLAPDLDLWGTATPEIEKWLKKQVGFKAFLKRMRENMPLWSEQMPELPLLAYEVLKEAKNQQQRQRFAPIIEKKSNIMWNKVIYFLLGASIVLIGVGMGMYIQ